MDSGRSINLALSSRGIFALEKVGLMERVRKCMLPMRGRALHDSLGGITFQAYGQRDHEVIYSVARCQLNTLLLEAAEETGKVHVHFHHTCTRVDFCKRQLTFYDEVQGRSRCVVFTQVMGTDGSGSRIRKAILAQGGTQNVEKPLGHGYKELLIAPTSGGGFSLQSDALHIWPRGEFMQIALPNLDGSFTATLFMPQQGEQSFQAIDTETKLQQFYGEHFRDSLDLMPDLAQDYFNNPTGNLMTVKCVPWHYQDQALILGDAAHAIVPFHGQGINCGFEDCVALVDCLEKAASWDEGFQSFEALRKPNTDAIADLALANYVEMRSQVRDRDFHLKKQIAFYLESLYPDFFIPQYSMVMFHQTPYYWAQQIGEIQERILDLWVDVL